MKLIEKRANSKQVILWDSIVNKYKLIDAIQDLGAYQQGEIELKGNELESELLEIYIDNFDGTVCTANFLKNCTEVSKEYFDKIEKLSCDMNINVDYSADAYDLIYDIVEAWGTDDHITDSTIRTFIEYPSVLTLSDEDEGIIVFSVADKYYKI